MVKGGFVLAFQPTATSLKEVWDLCLPQWLAEGASLEVVCGTCSIKEERAFSAGISGSQHLKVHREEKPGERAYG